MGQRIEIVDWERSHEESNQKSSQSISLEELMRDQLKTSGAGKKDDCNLTIDNLWKILSQEKHQVGPTGD